MFTGSQTRDYRPYLDAENNTFPKSLFTEKVKYNATCLHFSDYNNFKTVIIPALVSTQLLYRCGVLSLILRSLIYD